MKSCYGNFIGTTKNIMLWEIMLWKDHVRRGLAVLLGTCRNLLDQISKKRLKKKFLKRFLSNTEYGLIFLRHF